MNSMVWPSASITGCRRRALISPAEEPPLIRPSLRSCEIRNPIRALDLIRREGYGTAMADVLFEQEELLGEAASETGLSNFGPDHFREGLGVLIESLTNDSALKPEHVARARTMIITQLKKRLMVQEWYDRHPEILQQQIKAPIFILGSP